ncbi:Duf221 domain-containing protein [Mycena kentingensis (nom. inval.)]|nr:Duf221 domain-containing protein [Mycena kentingensis (nom. inval.)]
MSTSLQPFQDAYEAGRTLAPAAVGTQVLLMSAISLVTLVLFNLLRPRNKIIYEPKVKYHVGNKAPPTVRDTFCGWLPPLIHTKEPELLDKIGLDAVAFLRFLRLMRQIFAAVAILVCGSLIPIDYLYNKAHVKASKRDALSMLTIRDVKGERLYAHMAASYLICFIVLGFVYLHGRAMVKLRNDFFRSPEYMKSFYARTISITHIPKRLQQDAGLSDILGKNAPYHPTSLHIGRAVGDLPQLVEYHNETVRQFEAVLVKYLKGGVHNKPRPTVSLGGFFGMGAVRKDAIEYYTAKLKKTEAAVEEYRARIDARRPENYGFASYAAVPYAHFIAKHAAGRSPRGATVTLAPNPKDIIWTNMNKTKQAIGVKRMIGYAWLTVICFLSLIPLLLVAALANMDAVTTAGYLPFLEKWLGKSAVSFAIFSGVVPPAISGIFTIFLPRIMRWLGRFQGAQTHARLDRAVVGQYFAFLVISQLVVFTLIGVVINSVTELVEQIGKHASSRVILANLDKLPGRVSKTYINTSTYWLKFFPLRGFLVVFDLAQIINLVWISFKTKFLGRTPRDVREWTKPPRFQYAIYYSNLLFMCAVGLVFAPLVPLVALAAAVVFWISSWVYKYQLMFVFVTKVETGGRLWNVVVNRVLFSLFLMQCLMVLTVGLTVGFRSVKLVIAFPPIILLLIFKLYIDRKFNKNFYFYLPNEEELRTARVHSSRGDTVKHKLENRFGHPALHAELFTPMVHADQMQLLKQVYGGKVEEVDDGKEAGKGMELLDGLRIQPIQQCDLQYDPVLYSRDRGEYDYDRYSIASSTLLSPSLSMATPNSPYKINSHGPATLSYAPQSNYYADGQSFMSSSSGDAMRQSMAMSPSPAPTQTPGYFDPRLSAISVPPPMHMRTLSQSQAQPFPSPSSQHTRASSAGGSINYRPMSAVSQESARLTQFRESMLAPRPIIMPEEQHPMSPYYEESSVLPRTSSNVNPASMYSPDSVQAMPVPGQIPMPSPNVASQASLLALRPHVYPMQHPPLPGQSQRQAQDVEEVLRDTTPSPPYYPQ